MTATAPPKLPLFFRLRWLVGFVTALIAPGIMIWFWLSGSPWVLIALPLVIYGFFPLADLVLGEDRANLTESQEKAVEKDPYFKALLYLTIPVYAVSIFAALITAGVLLGSASV
ncbi:MAG: hypothetical protein P8R39_10190, partial [Alphaproteobacteria bacterium]|nr:hypothetical protein [Alphaproteobacteria bacterium]